MHPMTPRLFTAAGAVGTLVGLLACVGGAVLAAGHQPNGLPILGYSVVLVVFAAILFVLGLELWSDCDRLAEYDV